MGHGGKERMAGEALHSCRAAVRQAQAEARLKSQPLPADDTSAYCQARLGWPLELLGKFLDHAGRTLEQRTPQAAQWCGRVVKVIDASRHFGAALLRAGSQAKRLSLLTDLLRILAADAVPLRPGCVEPHALKRGAKPFPKLDCPRRQFRDIPHRHEVLAARAQARRNRTLG